MIKCNLSEDVNTCMHYDKTNKTCLYNNNCSFQRTEDDSKTVTKEKWYKKYYKNWN